MEYVMPGKDTAAFRALDDFTQAYIEAFLWVNEELDDVPKEIGFVDIDPKSLDCIVSDCASFQAANRDALAKAYQKAGYTESSAGHDFLLTRCGHGVGYWDRDLGDVGETLTEAADKCGEVYAFYDKETKLLCHEK